MENKKIKSIIVGNQSDSWIIKELFHNICLDQYQNIEYWKPYDFPDKRIEKEYWVNYHNKNRRFLREYSCSRWRKYSTLKNLQIAEDEILYLFVLYGRDVQRLYDPILLRY